MKKPSVKNLFTEFKNDFEIQYGITLDFRTHVFLHNNHGLSPIFDYHLAEKVVRFAYDWAENIIEENPFNDPTFDGWQYNLQMSCDELRTTTLKDFLSGIFWDLENWYEPRAKVSDFEIGLALVF